MSGHAVIVGASLGGLRAAEQLKAAGWAGPITVVGSERHMPYNRPPLSKEVLTRRRRLQGGTIQDGADAIHGEVAFRVRDGASDVAWRLGCAALSASLDERMVALDDGTQLHFDALVVATGLRSRRLPFEGGRANRHAVRTLDDAVRLRAQLASDRRVVVVGGGFIGCEVAASALQLGCAVSVVEPLPVPQEQTLGEALAATVQRYHEAMGLSVFGERYVTELELVAGDRHQVGAVVLDDGQVLQADVVVEAIGSDPNVEWLQGNGLDLSDGVLCDDRMRIEGRPDLVGVGDVARFPNRLFDEVPRRVEHWRVPSDTAKRAAATLAAHGAGAAPDRRPFTPVPTFWSDQFDLRIQGVGAFTLGDRRELLEGSLEDEGFRREGAVVGSFAGDRLVGIVSVGVPPSVALGYRRSILETAPPVEAIR